MIWGLTGLSGLNPLSQVVSTFTYADILQHRFEMNVYFNQVQKRSGPAVQIKFQETLFPLVASALEKVL